MSSESTEPDHTWAAAWLDAMGAESRGYAERLGRGPYYVSRGAVRGLEVAAGQASASFQHGRQRSQHIVLEVEPLPQDQWEAMVHTLAGELRFTAAITDGELPAEAVPLLDDAGVDLVPARDEVTETCNCTESGGDPCRHIASVHHAVARELDEDPFLLLRLRGRDVRTLRAAMRASRTGEDLATAARSPDAVGLDELEGVDVFASRGDVDAIVLQPRRVEDPAWLFDQLGEPPGFDDPHPLEELIVRAADTAWKIAAGDGSEAADTELLLTELRAQRVSTPPQLAEALGWDVDVVADALEGLYHDDAVMRMGDGLDAKYRAAS
jgi:uncharacterized Zn finger protein